MTEADQNELKEVLAQEGCHLGMDESKLSPITSPPYNTVQIGGGMNHAALKDWLVDCMAGEIPRLRVEVEAGALTLLIADSLKQKTIALAAQAGTPFELDCHNATVTLKFDPETMTGSLHFSSF